MVTAMPLADIVGCQTYKVVHRISWQLRPVQVGRLMLVTADQAYFLVLKLCNTQHAQIKHNNREQILVTEYGRKV